MKRLVVIAKTKPNTPESVIRQLQTLAGQNLTAPEQETQLTIYGNDGEIDFSIACELKQKEIYKNEFLFRAKTEASDEQIEKFAEWLKPHLNKDAYAFTNDKRTFVNVFDGKGTITYDL